MASADLAARLRAALTGAQPRPPVERPVVPRSLDRAERAARELGGTLVECPSGTCLAIDRVRRAPVPSMADTLDTSPNDLLSRLFGVLAARSTSARGGTLPLTGSGRPLLFFDLETTGLAGGAGTQAFIVGFGWFEDDRFRVRQFLLPGLDLERPLLEAAAQEVSASHGILSYNGRSFDVPLIETRYLYHRMAEPFTAAPHLDLLHPARRLWSRDDGCALTTLERRLLAVERPDDVPGAEIPARYYAYLRSGDAMLLEPVLEHNRMDLVTLAGLTMRLACLYEAGPEASRDGGELLGLGRLFERTGLIDLALGSYDRAASLARHFEGDLRLEAWHRQALLLRRQRRHADALGVWEMIADDSRATSAARRDALRALAVHHEHRSKDLTSARAFTLQAVRAEQGRHLEAANHRLARLHRKLGVPENTKSHVGLERPEPGLLDPSWS